MSDITYKTLGNSGLFVAPIIVGCMTFGDKRWSEWLLEDEEEIMKILKKCYDSGLRTFDTADVYSNGKSEILLRKFMEKYQIPRNRIQILSKCNFPLEENDPGFFHLKQKGKYPQFEYCNAQGLSRKHILDAVKDSNRRLGTYIDVLQIHRFDPNTPKKETMRALNDAVELGYTRYIGASSMKATQFAELQYIAELNGWHKFISMQSFYNLLDREDEREMNHFCKNNDLGEVGLIPYSPLAKGLLARPYGTESEMGRNSETDKAARAIHDLTVLSETDQEIIARVEQLSQKHGVSMAVIATAWVINRGCHPIVGLNSEKRIDDIVKAINFKLTDEEMEYLQEPYKPKFPYA